MKKRRVTHLVTMMVAGLLLLGAPALAATADKDVGQESGHWMLWLEETWAHLETAVLQVIRGQASSAADTSPLPLDGADTTTEPAGQDQPDPDDGDEMGGSIEPFG